MGWLKRNLFFAIGGILGVGLLGAGGFYFFQSYRHNATAFANLNEVYDQLKQLKNESPSPGDDKVNNTEAAREQTRQLREWIKQSRSYFNAIAPIPDPTNHVASSAEFSDALHATVARLQRAAADMGVALPPQYGFSFQAELPLVRFAPGSLKPLSTQLGEVRTICDILFDSKINALDSIQREPVSADDATGLPADYTADRSITNDFAVRTPYTLTFRCFSTDLADALVGFASSKHGFVVKNISVTPANMAQSGRSGANPNNPEPVTTPVARGGLQTVLDEQLLSVTLNLEVVKLLKN